MQRVFIVFIAVVALVGCGDRSGSTGNRPGVTGSKLPYGKPVPGKPGLVYSPYSESEVYIDVRGFDRGTEVRDPWTQKIFLVP